jgi:hypothetical protein
MIISDLYKNSINFFEATICFLVPTYKSNHTKT